MTKEKDVTNYEINWKNMDEKVKIKHDKIMQT